MPNKEEHIKIGLDRHVTVPEALRRIAVQYDHNVETVTFDCPRFWDGHDLSKMTVYINYMRKDRYRDKDVAENIKVDESDEKLMHFTWTVSRNATLMKGELKFLVCVVDLDDKGFEKVHWNSELCDQMYVTEGLECDDAVKELHADIITDLLLRMDRMYAANTPILSRTLTESGLAADAKVTGDAIDVVNFNLMDSVDSLTSAIEDEMNARKSEIAVERARIDNFTSLQDGSTTGDAELTDIRIGMDGANYPTAGDAVRGQINQLTDISTSIVEWEFGAWSLNGPDYNGNKAYLRTVRPLSDGIVSIQCPDNMQMHLCAYDENKTPVLLCSDGETFTNETLDDLGRFKHLNITSFVQNHPNWEFYVVVRHTAMADFTYGEEKNIVIRVLRGHEKIIARLDGFNYAERPANGLDNFSVEVNYHASMDTTEDSGELIFHDYGVLALPATYTTNGDPTRLIIFCQGTGERIGQSTDPLNNYGWSYFLAKGYAVLDMNGMSVDWGARIGVPITNQHYCNKYLLQSYRKGYEYAVNKYNLKKEVFIAGISMGGGASALIVQSRIIPVLAHVAFCPALSVYKQDYMKPWGGTNQQVTIAGQWGFDDWANSNPSQEYFLKNIEKIKGFDNLLTNTFGSSKDEANRNYGNEAEANAYNSLSKIYPVPLKIWHAKDDNVVLYRYSEFMVNMIRNADGQAWLRSFDNGGHVGGWNNGNISDLDVDGNVVTTSIPFYEAILFLRQWELTN